MYYGRQLKKKSKEGRNRTHVKNRDEEPVEEDDGDADVSSRPPWDGKRRTVVGDLTPVQGDDTHRQAMDNTKHLVDLGVVGRDPTGPREAG